MDQDGIKHNFPLSQISSFSTGGNAEALVEVVEAASLKPLLEQKTRPLWVLGYCANSLISDNGLPGLTILLRNTSLTQDPDDELLFIADAGLWWDDFVKKAVDMGLWGAEMASGIPGSVGAAVVGNIAAYGHAVSDILQWVEVIDTDSLEIETLPASELGLGYRDSDFYKPRLASKIILRAAFKLSRSQTKPLEYQSALDIAKTEGLDPNDLVQRREIILKARARAGSIYDPYDSGRTHSAGSFFKNPLVTAETADRLTSFEEFGHSKQQIALQNIIHGGEGRRVSAAHVLLAAGFKRGQTWGPVRLHPSHVLKIENAGGATSQQIYDVAQEIVSTVREKLGVEIEPEVQFLGEFKS